ncbi:hypothetical protein G7046_g8248 [Stylonectria norvegica]|nr:hypothetical protein G7046_g8248 [Stylonectria norvegica]
MSSSQTTAKVFYPILGYVRAELIINCIIVFVVLVVVTLRVVGRISGPGLGLDDALVIFATPLGVAMLICQGIFAPIGNGYSMIEHPELAQNVAFILELTFGMVPVYVALLAAVKASMLSFFMRVFVTSFMQRASKIGLGFVAAWAICYILSAIFLCNPISGQWTGVGKCGQYIPMIQSLIATNAIGDLIIMTLPMHSIWSLHTRKSEKLGITACFALGLACVVCAVFRLIYISTVDISGNISGTMPTTVFLFTLEPNLAILCVSIPMLRPFYAKYKKRIGGSRLEEYSDERSNTYQSQSQTGTRSRTRAATGQESISTWEMEDRFPQNKSHQDSVVAGYGYESGSEKNLTAGRRDEIKVETRWAVSRS